ncbi:alpha/beta fold hydrolase [Allonocardiopsis opalescens]|uniref:Pimeloyl-ACP methyl ester carboxylesterase n=1 Tax=Allonocardiopsis opalescens TaxID=1144618 RepID=A0A2T0PYV3_9ACTN|nr:alpha/beta hydrolase [Allonocardiopsis opalescens]PRX96714.1 pimeloyl-ACP methyl ester carboxylesterase [Allonocardiopsis opalescens]
MTSGPYPRHRDLALPGGTLRVHEAGPRDAEPVVLLHGAMLDEAALIWHHLAPLLAGHLRVIAPDLPRHGASRPWAGTLDQAAMEAVVDGLLDGLGLERVPLVGLSMGGGIATGYALARPERVRGLVAVNPGGLDAVRPLQFTTWLLLRSDRLLRAASRWIAAPSYLRRAIAGQLARGEHTPGFDRLIALAEAEARARARGGESALDDWQTTAYGPRRMRTYFTPRLHRLAVPSLWIHGGLDTAVPHGAVRTAARLAPGGEFAEVPDAGHLAPLDRPEHLYELITGFLDRLPGPRPLPGRRTGTDPDAPGTAP